MSETEHRCDAHALGLVRARVDRGPDRVAQARAGRLDVPRVELAARLAAAGLQASDDLKAMRAEAASRSS